MGDREGDRKTETYTEIERYTQSQRVEREGVGKRLGKRQREKNRVEQEDRNRDGVGTARER